MKSAVSCAFLVLTCWCTANAVKAENLSLSVIYHDQKTVDLSLSASTWFGENQKLELYRNHILLRRWSGCTLENPDDPNCKVPDYLSDAIASPGTHIYALEGYQKNEQGQWVLMETQQATADTEYAAGELHNSDEWQEKLGRGEVTWSPSNGTYHVANVNVWDGRFFISPGTEVAFDRAEGAGIAAFSPAQIIFKGATFTRANDYPAATISLYYLKDDFAAISQGVDQCVFGGVGLFLVDCEKIFIKENTFSAHPGDDIKINGNSRENLVEGNTFNRMDMTYVNPDQPTANVIRGNKARRMTVKGNGDLVEENVIDCGEVSCEQITCEITVSGQGSTVRANLLTNAMITVTGTGHTVRDNFVVDGHCVPYAFWASGADHQIMENTAERFEGAAIAVSQVDGLTPSSGITVKGNTAQSACVSPDFAPHGGILLGYVMQCTVRENAVSVNRGPGLGISSGSDNTVAFNSLYAPNGSGVFLQHAGFDGGNSVLFNHIKGAVKGLEVIGSSTGNDFHENVIEQCTTFGIELGPDTSQNIVYNNSIRENAINAVDNGTGQDNAWDRTGPGPNILGGVSVGGNFWGDYTGQDSDGDGFGESAYHPLEEWKTGYFREAQTYDAKPLVAPADPAAIGGPYGARDFGPVEVGDASAVLSSQITNTGGADLVVIGGVVEGEDAGDFLITENGCAGATLAPGASCTISTSFRPLSTGTKSAAISVASADPATPVLSVLLAGRGVVPLLGDLDGDYDIKVTDLIIGLQVMSGLTPSPIRLAGDTDGDGLIGLTDVLYIFAELGRGDFE